jgi:ABC-2 type transport system ATP-binding protein
LGKNKTILFSTHILQEVEALCDRVIVISKGRIVADNRIDELRDAKSVTIINVQFKEKTEKNLLMQIPGVLEVTQIDDHNWALESADSEKLNKELIGFTLQHSLNIVSLQTQTRRLEDIFRELTGDVS